MIRIRVRSHGIEIRCEFGNELKAVAAYVGNSLLQVESNFNPRTRRMEKSNKAVFAARTSDNSELRLLRADLEPLLKHLDFMGYSGDHKVEVTEDAKPTWDPIDVMMKPKFTPRNEQQEQAIEFTLRPNEPNRVLHCATGFGKTFCGFWAACQLKRRTAFIMEPSHIKTWLKDIHEYCDIAKEDILVIQGGDSMRALMDFRTMGALTQKFIFFSATTVRNYISDYENREEVFGYDIAPQDLLEFLGIGLVVRDEAHESIHALCKQVMYSNVESMLFLSATLVSDNAFINTIYERVFPDIDRWTSEQNQHICVRSVFYQSAKAAGLNGKGPRGYSHVAYEKQVMRRAKTKKAYWDLVRECVNISYLKPREAGMKCLVICATIKMAEFLAEEAKKAWPDLTVGCFVAGAKKAELYERDIVFSTPKGAGTGVDIPDLSVGWNTVAISSTQLQRQIMGRLRPLKNYDNKDPYFFLLWNKTVPQHMAYERKRSVDTIGKCKDYKRVDLSMTLGL